MTASQLAALRSSILTSDTRRPDVPFGYAAFAQLAKGPSAVLHTGADHVFDAGRPRPPGIERPTQGTKTTTAGGRTRRWR